MQNMDLVIFCKSIAQTESSVGFHYFDVDINNHVLKTDLSISQVRTEQLVESIHDFSSVLIYGETLRQLENLKYIYIIQLKLCRNLIY